MSRLEIEAKGYCERRVGFRLSHQPRGLRDLGRPDYANVSRKTLVFVHGEFWHGYGYPSRFKMPKTNREFWEAKILRNRRRHASVVRRARRLGWKVVTVWEREVRAWIRSA